MNDQQIEQFISFGRALLEETRNVILPFWRGGNFRSELKDDNTPVSEVDLKCEELARDRIRAAFPSHGIIGEEYGNDRADAELVWVIDPIDGTQNLVNRIPTFGTIVSLLHNGRPLLGWIDHPVLGDTLYGGAGYGAFHNGKSIRLDDLPGDFLTANDVIGTNCPATFMPGDHLDVLPKILQFHPHVRMYYDVYAHTLATLGSLAVHVEYNLKIWDIAASQALIEGAGGQYYELGSEETPGRPVRYHALFGKPKAVELLRAAIESQGRSLDAAAQADLARALFKNSRTDFRDD